MLNPGAHNCVEYIFQKSFRIQIKLDVTVKIFMTQSWKKNSAYQWKDQDSFKIMDAGSANHTISLILWLCSGQESVIEYP